MTTATAPDPILQRTERRRFTAAKMEQIPRHEGALKHRIALVLQAEEELKEYQAEIVRLNAQIDAAVQRHLEATAPLQETLDDTASTPAQRIKCRADVNEKNLALEAEIEPLKKLIAAAEQEAAQVQRIVNARANIESAWTEAGNGPHIHRLRVLRVLESTLDKDIFAAHRRCGDADSALANAAEKHRETKSNAEAVEIARADAKRCNDVAAELTKIAAAFAEERNLIRRARIAELYK